MAKTFNELIAGANKIRTNELPETNTHTLVGEQILEMVNKQVETDKKVDDNKKTGDENLKVVKEELEAGISQLEQDINAKQFIRSSDASWRNGAIISIQKVSCNIPDNIYIRYLYNSENRFLIQVVDEDLNFVAQYFLPNEKLSDGIHNLPLISGNEVKLNIIVNTKFINKISIDYQRSVSIISKYPIDLAETKNGYIYPISDFKITSNGGNISIECVDCIFRYNEKRLIIHNVSDSISASECYVCYFDEKIKLSQKIEGVLIGHLNSYGHPQMINLSRYYYNGKLNIPPELEIANYITEYSKIASLSKTVALIKAGDFLLSPESVNMGLFNFHGLIDIDVLKCDNLDYFKRNDSYKELYITYVRGKSSSNASTIFQIGERLNDEVGVNKNVFVSGLDNVRDAISVQTFILKNSANTVEISITVDWNALGTDTKNLTQEVRISAERLYHKALKVVKETSSDRIPVNILLLGDSVIEFGKIHTYIQELLGDNVVNCGIGGTTIAKRPETGSGSVAYSNLGILALSEAIKNNDFTLQDAAVEHLKNPPSSDDNSAQIARLKEFDFSSCELIIVAAGTNDFGAGTDIEIGDENENSNTIRGAIRQIIDNIQTTYPHIKLTFVTPTHRFFGTDCMYDSDKDANKFGRKLIEYVDAIILEANINHIPVLDNYRNSGMNKYNHWRYFKTNDGVHPNDRGDRLIASKISGFIKSNWV